jgi:hypothetical protein
MCKIKDCDGKVVAHGLCQKHYMRLRRHGDPEKVGKRGPRLPEWQKGYSAMMSVNYEQSARTHARQLQAFRLLRTLDSETHQWAIKQASRPNGSLNTSKLLHIAIILTLSDEEDEEEE